MGSTFLTKHSFSIQLDLPEIHPTEDGGDIEAPMGSIVVDGVRIPRGFGLQRNEECEKGKCSHAKHRSRSFNLSNRTFAKGMFPLEADLGPDPDLRGSTNR